MSEKDFLEKHWALFVEYISSLPPHALEQQRQDYALLAAEDPETFRSHLNLIDAIYRRGAESNASLQDWVEPPESRVRHTDVRRTRQAGAGLPSTSADSI